jgi:excinuclease ABC subunit B
LLRRLVDIQYTRNDMAFNRGTFRVRGDTLEIIPAYEELAVRIEMFGDEVEKLYYLHPLTGDVVREVDQLLIFPATHYAAGPERMERAISGIEVELEERLAEFERQGKLLEAQRLRMRTSYDIEMMRQVGFCSGIENYSRHIDGREAGSAPHCLLDYFPDDFLTVIDESHVTVPQIGGMYEGDASRKRTLIEHGFRLPSAADNRPLRFDEFTDRVGQVVYLSATPGPYEMGKVQGEVVEQVIRPTGLVDPEVVVKPTKGQIDDLIHESASGQARERVLITTLTRDVGGLTIYLLEHGIGSATYTPKWIRCAGSAATKLRRGDYGVWSASTCYARASTCGGLAGLHSRCRQGGFHHVGTSLAQTISRAAGTCRSGPHAPNRCAVDGFGDRPDESPAGQAVAYNVAGSVDRAAAQEDRRHHRRHPASRHAGRLGSGPAARGQRSRPADVAR